MAKEIRPTQRQTPSRPPLGNGMSGAAHHSSDREYEEIRELLDHHKDTEAYERAVSAATAGSAAAQLLLGWLYQRGIGVRADDSEAEKWYREAAERDWPHAQFYLGSLYRIRGQYDHALHWFGVAAAAAYGPAAYQLGRMHLLGEGVPPNRREAFRWFEDAAARGHLFARRNIARDRMRGRRGIREIPRGFLSMLHILYTAARTGWRDPESELFLRQR